MMTVSEVSRLTGVSIRTLQYYDKIGLLHPSGHTEAGYRLYDDTALAALQQILLFREMEFPLKDIRQIMTQPGFDRKKALTQQMELLTLKKQRLENLIDLARRMQQTGGKPMDFTAFDTTKLEEYAHQAKQAWGTTPEYQEFEGKSAKRTPQESNTINAQLMAIVAAFGTLQTRPAQDPAVQAQVKTLKDFITRHYYTCNKQILAQLGQMYAACGEFTKNINAAGGPGAAEFAARAIEYYCRGKET